MNRSPAVFNHAYHVDETVITSWLIHWSYHSITSWLIHWSYHSFALSRQQAAWFSKWSPLPCEPAIRLSLIEIWWQRMRWPWWCTPDNRPRRTVDPDSVPWSAMLSLFCQMKPLHRHHPFQHPRRELAESGRCTEPVRGHQWQSATFMFDSAPKPLYTLVAEKFIPRFRYMSQAYLLIKLSYKSWNECILNLNVVMQNLILIVNSFINSQCYHILRNSA